MKRLLLGLLLLCWPGAAFAKFAPVDGQTLRFAVAEDRAGTHFTSERRIVFRKAADGYTAELTIIAADAAGGGRDVGAMARRVLGALVGRTIRYTLNDAGMVVSVADQDALMIVVIQAFGAMAKGGSPERQAVAGQAAAALGALPTDSQRQLLASLLTPAIGGALADAVVGEGAVSQPATSPMGQRTELKGRQTVARTGDRIVIDTDASGPAGGDAMLRIVQHREIDAATGLVLVSERRTDSWLTTKPDAIATARTVSKLSPVL